MMNTTLVSQDLQDASDRDTIVFRTFTTNRVVHGQSVESTPEGRLVFRVSHQFGRISDGLGEFFGLDQSTIRLGFEYGFNKNFSAGIGRSSYNKTLDTFVKYKFVTQNNAKGGFPLSFAYYGNLALDTRKSAAFSAQDMFSSRYQHAHQLIIARKFNQSFSLQLSPTYIGRKVGNTALYDNNVYALGAAARLKISYRTSINAEYFHLLSDKTADMYQNSLSLGVTIKKGGHVFQLFVSNSQGLIEQFFIPQSVDKWSGGDIHFGFSITRAFILRQTDDYNEAYDW